MAAAVHATRLASARQLHCTDILVDGTLFDPDWWLTARVGYPHILRDVLAEAVIPQRRVVEIDGRAVAAPYPFFRAPAMLAIDATEFQSDGDDGLAAEPREGNDGRTVGVVALVARPGGRAAQLIVRGPYEVASGIEPALRQVEALIQSYADQWMPERALWDAPAEVLLGDEVR